jgi:predicted membrane-bound spermidine synthase
MLYAIDLLGGCLGALLLSGYLIPVFGFWKTAWLTAAVNLAPILLAARACVEEKRIGR